jgi:hypothetical protein
MIAMSPARARSDGPATRSCRRVAPSQPKAASTQRDSTVLIAAPAGRDATEDQDRVYHSGGEAANSVTFIACLASPTQRSSAEQHIPAGSSGRNGKEIIKKRSARPRVSPLAPSVSRIGVSKATVPRPTSRRVSTISTRPLPAMCRAVWMPESIRMAGVAISFSIFEEFS